MPFTSQRPARTSGMSADATPNPALSSNLPTRTSTSGFALKSATISTDPIRGRASAQIGPLRRAGCKSPPDGRALLGEWNGRRRRIGIRPLAPLIVLDAEILDDFAVRLPELGRIGHIERLGERPRILDGHDALQRVVVGARIALDEV